MSRRNDARARRNGAVLRRRAPRWWLAGAAAALAMSVAAAAAGTKRVPAEWEPQEAIWLQWPGPYEKAHEAAFAAMANIIAGYQTLHILYASPAIAASARAAIAQAGGDPDRPAMRWHAIASDSAWMRDNGPVYVIEDGRVRVQNWRFDAWGGAFGADIPYRLDDRVPAEVARVAGLALDEIDIVHERGNLEFNGAGALILNWSVIGDPRRNPGYTRERAEADLKRHFGLEQVVFIEGVPEGDRTNGHIDGIARFIDPETVVVADCRGRARCRGGASDAVFDAAAGAIAAAGFTVIRDPVAATVRYRGHSYDTNYMNWLVGNGFVIAVGFGHAEADAAARARLAGYFPGRDVHIVEMLSSWAAGGGVHCHTNDQPAPP